MVNFPDSYLSHQQFAAISMITKKKFMIDELNKIDYKVTDIQK